ncbi:MAG: hypothetical protein V1755_02030 [Chloroflexota bacterium]
MKPSTLLLLNAILSIAFGLAFVLAPAAVGMMYELPSTPGGDLASRLLGAELLGAGLLSWLARNMSLADLRKAVLPALLLPTVVELIVSIMAMLSGVLGSSGWSSVVIYLLFALGFGYYQFVAPSKS